jgi:hypothetical protein
MTGNFAVRNEQDKDALIYIRTFMVRNRRWERDRNGRRSTNRKRNVH